MHTLAKLRAGELAGITRLQLREDLREFPSEIYALADSLQILDLSGNQLSRLPDDLPRLHQLRVIFCSDNHFTELPRVLGRCPVLTMVGFKANRIAHVPPESLPAQLRWLILTDNQIETLPDALGQCTQLQKLMLGEGASGVIHQASWHTNTGTQAVAVKLFKGSLTSDGLPACEMAACLHAGVHPHLISAMGQIEGHPDQTQGLVMPLIDPLFITLAGPPSLDSCTRDVYAPDTRFSITVMLQLALGMTRAAQHLHARGILHGDLYAHNLLHNGQGQVGLLQELLTRCDGLEAQPRVEARMQALIERCLDGAHASAPSWQDIGNTLHACTAVL